jgi:acetyltransferase-like isoleucine patch superfamily enzyme
MPNPASQSADVLGPALEQPRSLAWKLATKALLEAVLSVLPAPQSPVLARPGLHLRWRIGWLKGWSVRPIWRLHELLGGPRIRVGLRFSLQGRLIASGPGTVVLGDDVVVADKTTPFTHSREARIEIGSRSFVNGTRFGCSREITIGEDAILADARLMDTDFHPLQARRCEDPTLPVGVSPIRIGRNVWIGAGSAVLKGVSIGDNSVIAFGSVVTKDVGADTIAAGNPARPVGSVPR